MPNPFNGLTGNGCHIHASLWSGTRCAFSDPEGPLGVSKLGYNFLVLQVVNQPLFPHE